MLPDGWQLTDDVDDFLTRAGDSLRSRPALHNMAPTDVEKLRTLRPRRAGAERDAEAVVLGRLETGSEVRAVFYLTPRGRLGLTPLSAEQADALAAHLAALGGSLSDAVADHDTVVAFAHSRQRHTGAAPTPFWRTRLYRLGTLTPPQPPPRRSGTHHGRQGP